VTNKVKLYAISLGLALIAAAGSAMAQSRLGDYRPGSQLSLPLPEILPLSRLRVEIDGIPVDVEMALSGRSLLVTVPEGLSGRDHDIVIFRRQPDADAELGVWTFGVPSGLTTVVATGVIEVERREGSAGGASLYSGFGRLGFDVDDGRLRGGIGFVQKKDGRKRRIGTEVTDYFLESRRAAFGQDLTFRLGSQSVPAESLLLDDMEWRGASLRLADPAGRSDALAFVLQPGEASGTANLTGVEDPDARLAGVAGHVFPVAGAGFRADIVAYDGRADLDDGTPGPVRGAGLRLSGPLGQDLGDFSLDYAVAARPADLARADATALAAEAGISLLGPDHEGDLELRLSAARVGPLFYSPLNTDLIAGEGRLGAELIYLTHEWQLSLSADRARTNIAADPGQTTDEFRDVALNVTYSPDVFTGGFLNGVTFYGALYSEDQRRLRTPHGGPPPQDFRLQGASFGLDRFQPDHSWALGVKLDRLSDLSGAGTSEDRQRIEAAYAFTPDDLTTLTLRGEAGQRQRATGTTRDATVEVSLAFPVIPDLWSGYLEAGSTRSDIAADNAAFFGVELARDLQEGSKLLFRADYAEGKLADNLSPGRGWVLGLGFRHDFGAGRK
jgi:hypothetical protein